MAAPIWKLSQIIFRVKRGFVPLSTIGRMRLFQTKTVSQMAKPTSWFQYKWRNMLLGPSLALFGFSFKKEEEDVSEEAQIKKLVLKGIVARQNGKGGDASKAFHEALIKSTDFLNEKRITKNDHLNHRVYIYDQIANLSMDMMDYKNAEAIFKDTMKLALQLGMEENNNAIIEMSLKLSRIYLYTGRTDLAVMGLNHCIAEQESKLKDKKEPESEVKDKDADKVKEEEDNTRVLLGMALKDLANHHLQRREFKKAKSLMERSLDISRSVLGADSDQTFVIMNDLATCHIILEEYERAEALLQEGIKQSGKEQSLMQSALLANLGALFIRTKRFEQAKTVCKKGLKIAQTGKDDFLIRPCENCLKKLEEIENINKAEK